MSIRQTFNSVLEIYFITTIGQSKFTLANSINLVIFASNCVEIDCF